MSYLLIVGYGAAGASAAWQASRLGIPFIIVERDALDAHAVRFRPLVRLNNLWQVRQANIFDFYKWLAYSNNGSVLALYPGRGGRTQKWSGWTSMIQPEKYDFFPHKFWSKYNEINDYFQVAEYPSSVSWSRPPYEFSKTPASESSQVQTLKAAFVAEGFAITSMVRPGGRTMNFAERFGTLDRGSYVNTIAKKLVIKGGRCIGLECVGKSGTHVLTAENYILCLSAFATTALLIESLENPDYPTLGRNIFDHPYVKNSLTVKIDKLQISDNSKFVIRPSPSMIEDAGIDFLVQVRIENLPAFALARLTVIFEPELHEQNYMSSSDGRIKLNMKQYGFYAERDRVIQLLASAIARSGFSFWLSSTKFSVPGESLHEFGGAVIGPTSATSVVDQNGKVHGLENVYVGDSSAFPYFGVEHPCIPIASFATFVTSQLSSL